MSFTTKVVSRWGKKRGGSLKKTPQPIKSSLSIWPSKSFVLRTILTWVLPNYTHLFNSPRMVPLGETLPSYPLHWKKFKKGHTNNFLESNEVLEILSKPFTTLYESSANKRFYHNLDGKLRPNVTYKNQR